MILVFFHGPPAGGEYTIGSELAERTGFDLTHSYLEVDEVPLRNAFVIPEFVAERDHA